ncbi:MAG: AzlC family ABC transporter permease [Acidimicrobiales bacterium]|nr:AzlC family ABC transporter permease [Acidimicrobiales bacterium]
MELTDHRRSAIRLAAGDTIGVGLGLFPIGMAFGLLVVQSGLDWWWAPVFSTLVYAGSMEFLLIGLVSAMTPIASIAATTLLVNGRHAFYGLSFPLHRVRHRVGRAYSVYALTDEAYALAATLPDEELSGTRIVAIQVLCQTYWVTGGIVGALGGTALPGDVDGLAFALTALFVVLAIDAIRATRDVPTPLVAVACALVAMQVAPDRMLLVALALFTVALLVRYRFAGTASWPGRRSGEGVVLDAE